VIDRRKLMLGMATAGLVLPKVALADTTDDPTCRWPPPGWTTNGFPSRRWVNIIFSNTGETFKDFYVEDGVYSMDAVNRFSHVCRDFRANETKLLDPRLMDLLFVLHWKYCKQQINIFSGYRSAATNANIEGAAKNSMHIQARALDIHLPDVDNVEVALSFRTFVDGGVGMYPGKAFTHMDTGALRRWVG
jgi:uncharacterized protein YcbK (DUF882 family)